jgi:hypothetical protein
MLATILIIVIILWLLGVLSPGWRGGPYFHYGNGLGAIIVIVLILLLIGVI